MVLDKNEMADWVEEQDSFIQCWLQLVVECFGKEIIEISKKLVSHFVILKITLPTLKQTVEVKVHYKVKLNIFK